MNAQEKTASQIAEMLLQIGAVKLRPEHPFKWASGWNSPIYCDNRLSLSYPEIRTFIKDKFVELIKEKYPEVEAIAGVATAGIPQGAIIADALNLPFIYVRSSPKGHGMENLIEGKITKGQKVIVVEDLVSTGGSSLAAAEALIKSEFVIQSMICIFTYGFEKSRLGFQKSGIPLHFLSDYDSLLKTAIVKGYVREIELETLNDWKLNPENWKK